MWHHVCVTWNYATRRVWVYYGGRGDNLTDTVKIGFDCSGDAISDFIGRMDDVAIFNVELTPEQVVELMHLAWPATASNPNPYDGMEDVPRREVVLGWNPGMYANTHDVYFGTDFNDVNDASRTYPLGVLVSENQTQDDYPASGTLDLDFGTTYYWRVDEVNAAPDYTIHKGETWQFTTELVAYPIAGESISVVASSQAEGQGPENTINGSGLTDGLHSDASAAMWLTALGAAEPAWIEYEFDKPYMLHEMLVWNHNSALEKSIGFGVKEATVEYSVDGVEWTPLGTVELARAPGKPGYAYNTSVEFGGVAAKYVTLTIHSSWGGILKQYGLSEVQFLSLPVFAREPRPALDEAEVRVDATLSWRAGREATEHRVYIDTNEQAVIDGTANVASVTSPSYAADLDLASTYYWRVDEVNDAENPSVWQGDVWSFSTQEYIVVDGFETYTNDSPNRVFQTWIDGLGFSPDEFFPNGNNGNGSGSLVGYDPLAGEIMETTLVHGGSKAMPLAYDNTGATYSETTRTFKSPQDWMKHGVKALVLWFYGDPANDAQQMYVKINSVKVPYDGNADNLKLDEWQMWYIDLSSLAVSNVSTLSIGFDRIGAAGGQGLVLIDDLLLYSQDRQSITDDM